MRATVLFSAIAVACATATAVRAAPPALHRSGGPELVRHVAVRAGNAARAMRVSFDALGRRFELALEPVSLFVPGARTLWIGGGGTVEEEPPHEVYLAGRLSNAAGSRVRVSQRVAALDGVIVTDEETYYLGPAAAPDAEGPAGAIVVHRQSDLPPVLGRCGVEQAPLGTKVSRRAAAALRSALAGSAALVQAEISIVADYEFYQLHGANSAAVMQDTINVVNAIYERDLGVTLAIRNTVVYTTADDPFSATTGSNELLVEFSDLKGDLDGPIAGSDLAHLFTGRDLRGNRIGTAWLRSVCDGALASGLSQNQESSVLAHLVAHEIGHNFGAPHDPAKCTDPPSSCIMQPNLNCVGRSTFSPQSRNEIEPVVRSFMCLAPVDPPAPTPSPTRTRPPAPPPGTPTATPPRLRRPGR